ncbi:MAG: hypothetical protein MUE74_05975 [Bacteroidales bacterium]|jgi:hypothetical protein|nr:hypothetical protein [Bacteroidales bacterium]
MKKLTDVLVLRKEKDESIAQRREDYALKRDLQAREQNEAISKRLLTEKASKAGEAGSSDPQPTP